MKKLFPILVIVAVLQGCALVGQPEKDLRGPWTLPPNPNVTFEECGQNLCLSREEGKDLANYILRLKQEAKEHGAVEAK